MAERHAPSAWLKEELASEGFRMTKLRTALIDILAESKRPFSVDEIAGLLKKQGTSCHKVSLYRELEFLAKVDGVHTVLFHDGLVRYEFVDHGHHHHVVCMNCDAVEEVELVTELDEEEKRIAKQTKFQILRHSLEFFGLCANCK